MTKNILSLEDFKGKKSVTEKVVEKPINEMVDAIDDVYREIGRAHV